MSLKTRLSRIEAATPNVAGQIDVIMNEIVSADGTMLGAIAQVRTAEGWHTITRAETESATVFAVRAAAAVSG